MRMAVIDGSAVINMIEAPEGFVIPGMVLIPADDAAIGWAYAEGEFSPPAQREATSDDVNAEASNRIASGFMFQGKRYDYDDKAQKRITGAATLAGFAAAAGAPAGYLLWHGGEEPFAWIAMDNSLTEMDAPTCFAFGQAAAAWESAHVFAGRALKDMQPIPAAYTADQYWP